MSYVLLEENSYQTYTSLNLSVIDLTNSENLTDVTVLAASSNFAFTNESLAQFTSIDRPNVIDLTSIDSLYSISVLSPSQLAAYNPGVSNSVLLALRVFITIDFASRTSFNSQELLDFDPPQYWIGA